MARGAQGAEMSFDIHDHEEPPHTQEEEDSLLPHTDAAVTDALKVLTEHGHAINNLLVIHLCGRISHEIFHARAKRPTLQTSVPFFSKQSSDTTDTLQTEPQTCTEHEDTHASSVHTTRIPPSLISETSESSERCSDIQISDTATFISDSVEHIPPPLNAVTVGSTTPARPPKSIAS